FDAQIVVARTSMDIEPIPSCCYQRSLPPTLRCLLERIGHLQYPEFILMSPNDLHTNRQAFRREAAGNRDGRESGNGDKVARAHPVKVRLHLHTVNLGDVGLLHVKGRYLVDRTNHELICLHELTDTV